MSAVKPGRLHELGRGSFSVQVYRRCGECRRNKDLCLEGKRRPTGGSCVSDFDDCRFRAGIKDSCN